MESLEDSERTSGVGERASHLPAPKVFTSKSKGQILASTTSSDSQSASSSSSANICKSSDEACKLFLGLRVLVGGAKEGVIRYFGPVHFAEGDWCGIELDEPEGLHNGVVEQVRYFTCKSGHGIFAPRNKVSLIQDPRSSDSLSGTGPERHGNDSELNSRIKHCGLSETLSSSYQSENVAGGVPFQAVSSLTDEKSQKPSKLVRPKSVVLYGGDLKESSAQSKLPRPKSAMVLLSHVEPLLGDEGHVTDRRSSLLDEAHSSSHAGRHGLSVKRVTFDDVLEYDLSTKQFSTRLPRSDYPSEEYAADEGSCLRMRSHVHVDPHTALTLTYDLETSPPKKKTRPVLNIDEAKNAFERTQQTSLVKSNQLKSIQNVTDEKRVCLGVDSSSTIVSGHDHIVAKNVMLDSFENMDEEISNIPTPDAADIQLIFPDSLTSSEEDARRMFSCEDTNVTVSVVQKQARLDPDLSRVRDSAAIIDNKRLSGTRGWKKELLESKTLEDMHEKSEMVTVAVQEFRPKPDTVTSSLNVSGELQAVTKKASFELARTALAQYADLIRAAQEEMNLRMAKVSGAKPKPSSAEPYLLESVDNNAQDDQDDHSLSRDAADQSKTFDDGELSDSIDSLNFEASVNRDGLDEYETFDGEDLHMIRADDIIIYSDDDDGDDDDNDNAKDSDIRVTVEADQLEQNSKLDLDNSLITEAKPLTTDCVRVSKSVSEDLQDLDNNFLESSVCLTHVDQMSEEDWLNTCNDMRHTDSDISILAAPVLLRRKQPRPVSMVSTASSDAGIVDDLFPGYGMKYERPISLISSTSSTDTGCQMEVDSEMLSSTLLSSTVDELAESWQEPGSSGFASGSLWFQSYEETKLKEKQNAEICATDSVAANPSNGNVDSVQNEKSLIDDDGTQKYGVEFVQINAGISSSGGQEISSTEDQKEVSCSRDKNEASTYVKQQEAGSDGSQQKCKYDGASVATNVCVVLGQVETSLNNGDQSEVITDDSDPDASLPKPNWDNKQQTLCLNDHDSTMSQVEYSELSSGTIGIIENGAFVSGTKITNTEEKFTEKEVHLDNETEGNVGPVTVSASLGSNPNGIAKQESSQQGAVGELPVGSVAGVADGTDYSVCHLRFAASKNFDQIECPESHGPENLLCLTFGQSERLDTPVDLVNTGQGNGVSKHLQQVFSQLEEQNSNLVLEEYERNLLEKAEDRRNLSSNKNIPLYNENGDQLCILQENEISHLLKPTAADMEGTALIDSVSDKLKANSETMDVYEIHSSDKGSSVAVHCESEDHNAEESQQEETKNVSQIKSEDDKDIVTSKDAITLKCFNEYEANMEDLNVVGDNILIKNDVPKMCDKNLESRDMEGQESSIEIKTNQMLSGTSTTEIDEDPNREFSYEDNLELYSERIMREGALEKMQQEQSLSSEPEVQMREDGNLIGLPEDARNTQVIVDITGSPMDADHVSADAERDGRSFGLAVLSDTETNPDTHAVSGAATSGQINDDLIEISTDNQSCEAAVEEKLQGAKQTDQNSKVDAEAMYETESNGGERQHSNGTAVGSKGVSVASVNGKASNKTLNLVQEDRISPESEMMDSVRDENSRIDTTNAGSMSKQVIDGSTERTSTLMPKVIKTGPEPETYGFVKSKQKPDNVKNSKGNTPDNKELQTQFSSSAKAGLKVKPEGLRLRQSNKDKTKDFDVGTKQSPRAQEIGMKRNDVVSGGQEDGSGGETVAEVRQVSKEKFSDLVLEQTNPPIKVTNKKNDSRVGHDELSTDVIKPRDGKTVTSKGNGVHDVNRGKASDVRSSTIGIKQKSLFGSTKLIQTGKPQVRSTLSSWKNPLHAQVEDISETIASKKVISDHDRGINAKAQVKKSGVDDKKISITAKNTNSVSRKNEASKTAFKSDLLKPSKIKIPSSNPGSLTSVAKSKERAENRKSVGLLKPLVLSGSASSSRDEKTPMAKFISKKQSKASVLANSIGKKLSLTNSKEKRSKEDSRSSLATQLEELKFQLKQTQLQLDGVVKEREELQVKMAQMKDEQASEMKGIHKKHQQEIDALKKAFVDQTRAEIEKVVDQHSREVKTLKSYHDKNLCEVKQNNQMALNTKDKEYEDAIAKLKAKHLDELNETIKSHELQLNEISERFEEIKISLSNKVEQLRSRCDELCSRELCYKDTCKRESDLREQAALEVDGLRVVLEQKNGEIRKLRQENALLDEKVQEIPRLKDTIVKLQQNIENLEAVNHLKSAHERQLGEMHQVLLRKFERESKAMKRLSMEKEELIWRLSQSDFGPSCLQEKFPSNSGSSALMSRSYDSQQVRTHLPRSQYNANQVTPAQMSKSYDGFSDLQSSSKAAASAQGALQPMLLLSMPSSDASSSRVQGVKLKRSGTYDLGDQKNSESEP